LADNDPCEGVIYEHPKSCADEAKCTPDCDSHPRAIGIDGEGGRKSEEGMHECKEQSPRIYDKWILVIDGLQVSCNWGEGIDETRGHELGK